jgi:hypothetical protein
MIQNILIFNFYCICWKNSRKYTKKKLFAENFRQTVIEIDNSSLLYTFLYVTLGQQLLALL